VEEAPFVLTKWTWSDESESEMLVCTNLDDEFTLNSEHPLIIDEQGNMLVTVRRNLQAKVHRNVYYQWVELAKEVETEKGTEMMFVSAGASFSLGCL